ncbi:MAG: FAD-dependent oxidoreductase, partial [Clostridia bacterium]|nr:FAD-dependent oxidoreductase [Clostridia bacterium]
MKQISFNRQIDVYGRYDVAVLGGGPAGVCAAVSAARHGMNVILVEASPSLGGMATVGMVGPFMTNFDRDGNEQTVGGMFSEIVGRLSELGGAIPPETVEASSVYTSFISKYHRHVTPIDSFRLELVLDEMVREAGVRVLCYTQFVDCAVEDGRIASAVLSAPEGLIAVEAEIFVDCTGIAAVAHKAGVPTYKGDEKSGIPQPATLMFEVGGVDDDEYEAFGARPERPVKAYRTPVKGRYKVNHYHVYNVDAANAESMTEAHCTARRQVLDAFSVLRNKTRGFENSEILCVAPVLGVRESRHIEGEYKITVNDVSSGTKFDDRIAVYGFGMDVHNRTESESGNFKIEIAEKYYIPYRSL